MYRRTLLSLLTTAVIAAPVSVAYAAEPYDIQKDYPGGSTVGYNEATYRAKWWANKGQSPADVDSSANPWDTPWERIGSGGNAPPTVALTSPANGSSIKQGAVIRMSADAADKDGNVARVDFYINGQHRGGVLHAPFVLDWTNATPGSYEFKAVATDNAGAQTTSSTAKVNVLASGDEPLPGDTYVAGQSYEGGCVVIFKGKHFKAKWYANGDQSPADVANAANPWDTPWENTQPTAPGCQGGGNPGPGPGEPGPGPGPGEPGPGPGEIKLKLSDLNATEAKLTDFPAMKEVLRSISTLDNAQVLRVAPGRADNPENVRRVESIMDEASFEFVFPMRTSEYTYTGLLQAFAKFPAVCRTYEDGRDSDAICRKTLATMVAHFAQETGGHDSHSSIPEWRQALVHVREMGEVEGQPGRYSDECNPEIWQGKKWPCGKLPSGEFKNYFGRGAKQLSYNYNYGPFSEAMFGDVAPLLQEPELVADTWLNLASAVFFYSYPQPPKPAMMHVIDGTWQPNERDRANGLVPGFGVTTQIINGGVECGGADEHLQSANRIIYYKAAADYFGVPIPADEALGCKGMKQFDEGGAGSLPIYWEMDWSWVPENPGNKSYACKLVGYQRPFGAFKAGDYALCVAENFPEVEIVDDTK